MFAGVGSTGAEMGENIGAVTAIDGCMAGKLKVGGMLCWSTMTMTGIRELGIVVAANMCETSPIGGGASIFVNESSSCMGNWSGNLGTGGGDGGGGVGGRWEASGESGGNGGGGGGGRSGEASFVASLLCPLEMSISQASSVRSLTSSFESGLNVGFFERKNRLCVVGIARSRFLPNVT